MAIKINGSTIIDDSRKGVNFDSVGIGTTNPIEALDVQGTVHISRAASAFSPHLELFAEGTSDAQITAKGDTTWPDLIFRGEYGGAGPEYFRGVVDEQLSNGDYKTGLKLRDNKPVLFGTGNDALIEYDASPGVLEIKTVGAEPITVHTNFTERLRINSAGQVSIGTTIVGHNPADDFTIGSSGDAGITIRSGTSDQGSIFFSDGTSGTSQYRGAVQYDHSTDVLSFRSFGAEKLYLGYDYLTADGCDLNLTSYQGSSAAGPTLKLYRNSSTPADEDYLGQIKFSGESDGDVERDYAKIIGKISDASNTTEDGILEFIHIKAGTATTTGRWNSTELELLNDTGLIVSGVSTFQNHVNLGDNDELRFGDDNDLKIYHDGSNSYIDDNGTGDLQFRTINGTAINLISGSDYLARFVTDGSVELYYDNSLVLETVDYGVSVTGGLEVSGIVTASSYRGDGSQLTGVEAASFLFNTGITSSVSAVATGVGSTILTLPSLDGQKYIIHSILASNIAVGNTEVNFVGAFDFDGGERSYFANQIPVPTGTSVEMLKQPQVLNPNDSIIVRSTDFDRVGANDIIDVYVSYEEKTSADLIGIGIGTVGLALTSTTGIYTSSNYPSVVQSIRLVNRVDTGPKIASVSISNGVSTTFLVDNLVVPKYGSVEILDNPKSIQTNDVVQVQLEEGASINVQLSAKKITS